MSTTILAESRRGGKVAVIERINDDSGYMYRVAVSERFRALSKAQEAFLAAVPQTQKDHFANLISENTKQKNMEDISK